jgi:hypothetical protein
MLLVILLTMYLLTPWSFPSNTVLGQIIHNGKFLLLNGKRCFAGLTKGNHCAQLHGIIMSPMRLSGVWFVLLGACKKAKARLPEMV